MLQSDDGGVFFTLVFRCGCISRFRLVSHSVSQIVSQIVTKIQGLSLADDTTGYSLYSVSLALSLHCIILIVSSCSIQLIVYFIMDSYSLFNKLEGHWLFDYIASSYEIKRFSSNIFFSLQSAIVRNSFMTTSLPKLNIRI